jgi:glycosyltransferase involved in cell wall biosynthesis
VQDGVNGLLAQDTTLDMAERIAWALDHPKQLQEIGMAARQTIPKPWKEILTVALERYEKLIALNRRNT